MVQKSCTTWDEKNLVNNGVIYQTTGKRRISEPSTVNSQKDPTAPQWEILWDLIQPRQNCFKHVIIWVFPKIVGFPPKSSIYFNRVFHKKNHPFWGTPYFWKHPCRLKITSNVLLLMDCLKFDAANFSRIGEFSVRSGCVIMDACLCMQLSGSQWLQVPRLLLEEWKAFSFYRVIRGK